jgi:hypothetical protein
MVSVLKAALNNKRERYMNVVFQIITIVIKRGRHVASDDIMRVHDETEKSNNNKTIDFLGKF